MADDAALIRHSNSISMAGLGSAWPTQVASEDLDHVQTDAFTAKPDNRHFRDYPIPDGPNRREMT
jgi:hypothetical protein